MRLRVTYELIDTFLHNKNPHTEVWGNIVLYLKIVSEVGETVETEGVLEFVDV